MTALPALPQRQLRHAGMPDLITLLQQQHRQKVDVVVPTTTLRLNRGALEVAGVDPLITEDGVTELSGLYRPTPKVDADLANLFGIPTPYVRRLREEYVDLLDTNVNVLAERSAAKRDKVMLRLFYGSDPAFPETVGIARAVVSDKYGIRDNLDAALAVLNGMRAAGLGADNIGSCSLSDNDNLYLYVEAPEVAVNAPALLEGYRSPWAGTPHGGPDAETLPIVHAGFVVQNSETGGGALSVTPRLVVRICSNGLTIKKDALRKVHVGGRLETGQVRWEADTISKSNELIQLQMRDAVRSFLTVDYVQGAVNTLTETAGTPVEDAAKTIETVAKTLMFTEVEAAGILDHFIKGGQLSAGGVMQAVTSFSQTIEDVDRQNDVEAAGVDAMLVAARAF